MSKETAPLDEAGAIRDSLLAIVAAAGRNSVLESEELAAMRTNIEDYYAIARRTSERMIAGEVGEGILAALQQMTSRYRSVSMDLERRIVEY